MSAPALHEVPPPRWTLLWAGALAANLAFASGAPAPPGLPADVPRQATASPLASYYLPPVRLVWSSNQGVHHAENVVRPKAGQAVLKESAPPLELSSSPEATAGLLLDFGVEIQGFVEIVTAMMPDQATLRRVRVRFGESAGEAMAELGGAQNAGNDHALRDQVVTLPWLGRKTVGPSGFRFVRIDNADPSVPVQISAVRAVLQLRDIPYLGSFRCNDERLNRIWQVGAYTVHLNMQDYLWDGIKRDRLVWLGDMHPEVCTINAVFGYNEVVPKSLDLIRDVTPPNEWMNGISSYSMWWVLIQAEWWNAHGNLDYLRQQQGYLTELLPRLARSVGPGGKETLDGMRFLDWPTYENAAAVAEGLQAMMILTMQSGERLMRTLEDGQTADLCRETAEKLRRHTPERSGRKSPAALMALSGAQDAREIARAILAKNGPEDLSTFYGFYVLQALARAGDMDTGLDFISQYWGTMLDYGATTFWEGFDLAWTNNAARIDELVPPGKRDLHGDRGEHCYVGFRHSLCHGWASGPTAWLSQHVLGINPLEPGFKAVRVAPQLGRLQWAEGTYPTPQGLIHVRHERQADGKVESDIKVPPGIRLVRE